MNNNETLPLGSPEPRTRLLRIATHIIVLAIIFVLPEVIMSWGRGVPRIAYLHTLVYVAIFYLNYALLIERLLFRQRTWAFVGVNVTWWHSSACLCWCFTTSSSQFPPR